MTMAAVVSYGLSVSVDLSSTKVESPTTGVGEKSMHEAALLSGYTAARSNAVPRIVQYLIGSFDFTVLITLPAYIWRSNVISSKMAVT